MSAHYGFFAGVFAAVAATVVLVLQGLPAQSATQDFYDYAADIAMLPSAWLIAALGVGGLRSFHRAQKSLLRREAERASTAANELAAGLEQAVCEVGRLERSIATETTSLTALMHAISRLDPSNRKALLSSAVGVMRYGVGACSVDVYLGQEGDLQRVLQIEDDRDQVQGGDVLLPHDEIAMLTAAVSAGTTLPLIVKVTRTDSGRLVGLIVCHRLNPGVDVETARDRLGNIAQLLGRLLSMEARHD